MARAIEKINESEQRKIKKNPYKYRNFIIKTENKDDTDFNEIFGDFSESSETKISSSNNKNLKQKKNFDPFNNGNLNNNQKTNDKNWMNNNGKAIENTQKINDFDKNAFLNFDFIDPGTSDKKDVFSQSEFKFEPDTNKSSNLRSKSQNTLAVNNNQIDTNINRSKSPLVNNPKEKKGIPSQNVHDFFK